MIIDDNSQPAPTNKSNDNNKPLSEHKCESCAKSVTEKIAMFSTSKFGKKLCMDCQKKEGK